MVSMVDDTKDDVDNSIDYTEKTYLTSEVSKMLGMATTTIRKYSQSLESKGYSFTKGKGTGKKQARLFTEKDVTVLRYLKEIREETNITVERATSIVIERFGKGSTQDALPKKAPETTKIERYDEQHDELKEILKHQNDIINKLADEVAELREEVHNQNKQLEAPKEAEIKKSFFSRLFKK